MTSALVLTKASTLSIVSRDTSMAAPTLSLPLASLQALGNFSTFSISFIVISPFKMKFLFTIGNFSILFLCNIFLASSRVVPSGAVIKFSLVIISAIFNLLSSSSKNLISRLVKIPTNLFSLFTMGIPEI
jgi:hypothetical protein